ncbi:hypothetical protein K0M31_003897 [Melipona bicolor]|uniref:Uncharacterized protein n=1 Tax=Melipona bicolor TaxID=60889 RepID=A0AA40FYS0_9HYME|nr:hypothetical protein K0M31_003897 [Melipona bicolor]
MTFSGSDGPIPELCHEMDSLGPAGQGVRVREGGSAAVSPRRMSLVCAVGLREQEGTAIRVLAESRFRSEGQRGKSLLERTKKKG